MCYIGNNVNILQIGARAIYKRVFHSFNTLQFADGKQPLRCKNTNFIDIYIWTFIATCNDT